MKENELMVLDKIYNVIDYNNKDFSLENLTHQEASKKVYDYLEYIVDAVGVYDYLFIYSITKLEERHGKYMITYLYEILDNYINFKDKFNSVIAFAALYNIALHHTRYHETETLYKVINNNVYVESFRDDYPLIYEIFSRYFSTKGMFDKMFLACESSLRSVDKLKNEHSEKFNVTKYGYYQTGDNVALKVGVLAATCFMFQQLYMKGTLGKDEQKDNVNFDITYYDELTTKQLKNTILEKNSYSLDESLVCDYTLNLAKKYADEAIEYNNKYPKYHFLKAQVLFYEAVYEHRKIDFSLLNEMKNLINTARSLENTKAADYQIRCSNYDNFINTVDNYIDKDEDSLNTKINLEYYRKKDEFMKMEECPPPQKRVQPNVKGNDAYAFISYSTKNFKSVYCDLLAYTQRGINFWYDAGVIPGEKWHTVVEERIKNAEVIFCYLSEDFIKSPAVLKELNLFKKYNKKVIWIDLTGNKQISKIIVDVIRHSSKDSLSKFSSEMLHTLTDLIDDDVDMISRDISPQSEIHIDRMQKVIAERYPNIIQNLVSECLTVKNNKKDLYGEYNVPNEDYVINDTANRIYIVLDGITRPKQEYSSSKYSIASDLSKIFAEEIHDYITSNLGECPHLKAAKLMLQDAFNYANNKVKALLELKKDVYQDRELPGCVGIVSFMIDHTLVYGAVGDCMGFIIRNNRKIIFADKQTTFAFDCLHFEQDRKLLATRFINNINEPYSYGVVNGQEGLLPLIEISHINIDKGDEVYLVSDGVSDFIQFNKAKLISSLSLEEIINQSKIQDEEMKKSYFDDKTILRIKYGSN